MSKIIVYLREFSLYKMSNCDYFYIRKVGVLYEHIKKLSAFKKRKGYLFGIWVCNGTGPFFFITS